MKQRCSTSWRAGWTTAPGTRTTSCTLAASSTGLPHAFRIRGDQPARFLAIAEPGGLLHLYDEVGIPAAELRLPGPDGQTPEAGGDHYAAKRRAAAETNAGAEYVMQDNARKQHVIQEIYHWAFVAAGRLEE